MASGRVGGTKAKVSGQIGSSIYQVRKNPDGTYSQIVYAKGTQTVSTTTPRLQAQRMCTAMVECLMADLKEVARISMQSYPNKSKSLNAFSSFNLRLVAQDCKTNWYSGNRFQYPSMSEVHYYDNDLGGPFMISSGTLQFNIFDREVADDFPYVDWVLPYTSDTQYFYGVGFNITAGMTVGQFMKSHRMTYLDSFVFCGLDEYIDYDNHPDDPQTVLRHIYYIAKVNAKVNENEVMTADTIQRLFNLDGNADFVTLMRADGTGFAIGYLAEYATKNEHLHYTACFSISYYAGKKKISSSTYHNPFGDTEPWALDATPTYVFGSWMGEPANHHWPSPFE